MQRNFEQRTYIGFDGPVSVVIDPDEADLRDWRLKALLRQWALAAETGEVPPMRAMGGPALGGLRDFMVVLEVLDGGEDFRYLFHGPAVVSALSMDMTGQQATKLPSALANLLIDVWSETVRRLVPTYITYPGLKTDDADRWECLSIPLRQNSEKTPDRLIVAAIPIKL